VSLTKKDIDLIQALLEDSQFERLSLELDGVKVELARAGAAPARPMASPAPATNAAAPAASAGARGRQRRSSEEGLLEIRSPLLGVFYHAPKPGEPPFVQVGDRVDEDTAVGIIEVMKLMNSARAGVRGTVVEILVPNGEMVEHGEALMLVRPD
jgi:acetyl-CoA carboxylase biotin carboxyl carrier protein